MKLSKLIVAFNLLALSGLLVFSGCGDDDSPTPGVTADAGADQTVEVGSEVKLDGSGSSAVDGSSLEYLWLITDSPTDSQTSIDDDGTAAASFIPDVEGTYIITLTVTTAGGDAAEDEVVITAAQGVQPEEIGGVIDTDTRLVNRVSDPNLPDYIASSNVDVRARLTIDPGVVVYFDENVVLDIESGDGELIAEGTATDGIVLTTMNASGGILWKGIYIGSASALNSLKYVEVSYAGNSPHNFSGTDFSAAIGVESSGKVSLLNSTVINNNGYGLYIDDAGGQLENFSDNTFENNSRAIGVPADEVEALDENTTFANNDDAQVEIFATTLAETKTSTWKALNGNATYRVSGRLRIDGDLTIAPGAFFEFDQGVVMDINGSIIAEGTETDLITFTSSNVAGDLYWKGIYVPSASTLNSFAYIDLSYAGSSPHNFSGADFAAGIGVESSGKVSVINSTFTTNKNYGLYIEESGGELLNFSDNHFENNLVGVGVSANEADDMDSNTTFTNNSEAEVEIFATNLADTKTVTWKALTSGASYRLTGDMNINGELTLDPGVSIHFDQDVQVIINGALIADGTAGNPVTLTSSNTAGGLLWQGLYYTSADSRNVLDNVIVSYAGNSTHNFSGTDHKANVGINSGAVLTITNSTISNSGGYGIYNKGTLTESGNTFTNNVSGNEL